MDKITNEPAAAATLVGGRIGLSKETLNQPRKIAAKLNIDTTKVITHRVKYGLKKKGKGWLQVLWERGFIDETRFLEYKLRAEDDCGRMIPKLLLLHLMENCTYFARKFSQLEYVGKSLGIRVLITTKYHTEYAGEGVEYSWGYSKSIYRRNPISAKKVNIVSLHWLENAFLGNLLQLNWCASSAREHGNTCWLTRPWIPKKSRSKQQPRRRVFQRQMIEKMIKVVSSHRAALDFDRGYLD